MRIKLTEEEEEIGGDWINLGEIACKFSIEFSTEIETFLNQIT